LRDPHSKKWESVKSNPLASCFGGLYLQKSNLSSLCGCLPVLRNMFILCGGEARVIQWGLLGPSTIVGIQGCCRVTPGKLLRPYVQNVAFWCTFWSEQRDNSFIISIPNVDYYVGLEDVPLHPPATPHLPRLRQYC